jgi:hypothetical protein
MRRKRSSKAPYPDHYSRFVHVCHPNQTRHTTAATNIYHVATSLFLPQIAICIKGGFLFPYIFRPVNNRTIIFSTMKRHNTYTIPCSRKQDFNLVVKRQLVIQDVNSIIQT